MSGYTAAEKLEIARRYLVGRQMEANGVRANQVEITDIALRDIISHYTRRLASEISNVRSEKCCVTPRFA